MQQIKKLLNSIIEVIAETRKLQAKLMGQRLNSGY